MLLAQAGLAQENADSQPVHGGVLMFGVNAADPPTYDCHASNLFTIIDLLSPHYSNLLRIDPAHYPGVVGDLAQILDGVAGPDELPLHAASGHHVP